MGKVTFTKKQNDLMRLFKRNKLPRLTVLQGSVRSGKTWISLILWALWVATRPRDYLYMMTAKSLQTLKRNCLLPLQELIGERNFTFSLSAKEGVLFGRKIMLEGANDARSENKIRGITLGGAYCDELTLFPEDFFVMLLSRLSAPGAKLFATTNPDTPTHWLKKKYLDNKGLVDDLLNIFFGIDDNTTLPADYVSALKKEYTGTVYYNRFILGQWAAAGGIIYQPFADSLAEGGDRRFLWPVDKPCKPWRVHIGVDFGGNGSWHAFVATGILPYYAGVVGLASARIDPKNQDADYLAAQLITFCTAVFAKYGEIHYLFCDSAEQTLINHIRTRLRASKLYWLADRVNNSAKIQIIDRIRLTSILMGGGRFWYMPEAATLRDALASALWSQKRPGVDERLDDGTTDIDTLDAFEYTIERDYRRLTAR